ncbi:MAG TPA: hypothetical protein VGW77_32185, partial [Candidatus Binatia bacterium]|nr:hypothetical protein [Candidatus Binatia bacterium]
MTAGNLNSRDRAEGQVVITPFGLPYAAAQSFIRADTTFLLFLFVILAGTSVRFYGLDWGLP